MRINLHGKVIRLNFKLKLINDWNIILPDHWNEILNTTVVIVKEDLHTNKPRRGLVSVEYWCCRGEGGSEGDRPPVDK